MDSGGYTYVRLKTSTDEVWLAATDLKTKAGDRLTVGLDVPMQNFHSKTLNRDFPLIYFVSRVAREGESLEPASSMAGMPMGGQSRFRGCVRPPQARTPPANRCSGSAASGRRGDRRPVGEAHRACGQGRGRARSGGQGQQRDHGPQLVSPSGRLGQGRRWHDDLTITTEDVVTVGDIVTVSGTLTVGKDFGAGYAYDAIIENATIKR